MSVNNFLTGNKFSKSKKSIKDTVSSRLNDSLNEDFKRHSQIDSFNTSHLGPKILHNYNDKQRYEDDEEFDNIIHKEFNKHSDHKKRIDALKEDETTRPYDFQTDISAISNKQKKPKVKLEISNKNIMQTRQKSNFKSQREKVQVLLQQLSLQSLVQLQTVNKIIDSLDQKVAILIDSEFNKFKQAVFQTIERVFESQFSNFKKAFQLQRQKCLNKIQQVREQLQQMNDSLEVMKKQMKSGNWNKVQQNLKQAKIQKCLNVFASEIQKYKKTLPISISIQKNKMKNYQEALIALLDLKEAETYHHKRQNK